MHGASARHQPTCNSAFGPKSPFLFPLGLRAPRWVLVASVALQMQ